MPTTTYTDASMGARAIGARTDAAGLAATDLSSSEDRLINDVLTEGFLTTPAFVVSADSPASMNVIVGSGVVGEDLYVVGGDDAGQHNYLCRLDSSGVTVTLDAADASNGRIDEIWLVVLDNTYDASGLSLPRIAYRKGDALASPAPPGPDASWKAAVKLATITVSAGVTSITSGNIADNRSVASLTDTLQGPGSGLDADTVDGVQAAALAKLAGGTFTGPVTLQGLATFEAGIEGKLAADTMVPGNWPTAWPTGMSWQVVAGGAGWPTSSGVVVTFNFGDAPTSFQVFYDVTTLNEVVTYTRRWGEVSNTWREWVTTVTAENPGTWEVDGHAEVTGPTAIGTSLASVASVNLTIPSDWTTWKCYASATYGVEGLFGSTATLHMRVVIDGTAEQTVDATSSEFRNAFTVQGRREGMSTTGSRTVSLQLSRNSGDDAKDAADIFLYARAVRTS